MAGLVPGIHVLWTAGRGVDGRDKPGHDVVEASAVRAPASYALALQQAGRGEANPPTVLALREFRQQLRPDIGKGDQAAGAEQRGETGKFADGDEQPCGEKNGEQTP